MRITLVNQFYPPDISPTGRLAASVAEHRASLGDEVTVIAGQGYVEEKKVEPREPRRGQARFAPKTPQNEPVPAAAKKGVRNLLPERPAGCFAQKVPDPFYEPRVLRIWTPRLGKGRLWRRALDYLCFYLLAAWKAVRLRRQDVVICLTTPPFIVSVGLLHKLLHPRTRVILWNMDCYPEVAERAGVIRQGGLVSRLLHTVNKFTGRRLDHTVCLDQAMRELMLARRVRKNGTEQRGGQAHFAPKTPQNEPVPAAANQGSGAFCRNGPPDAEHKRLPTPFSVINNWEPLAEFPEPKGEPKGGQAHFAPKTPKNEPVPAGVPKGGQAHFAPKTPQNEPVPAEHKRGRPGRTPFSVLYSGNMGHGHCFETMIEAAQRLDDEDGPVRFVFTGGGAGSKSVHQQVRRRKLRNVDLLGYVPGEQLRSLQEAAGCSLITLREDMLGVMSPSKLHSSLAMGLPILYIGPRGSNVHQAVENYQCGASFRHGDIDSVVEFLKTLTSDPAALAGYRARARQAFEAAYSDRQALPKFDRIIELGAADQPARYTGRAA